MFCFFLLPFYEFSLMFKLCLCGFFVGDVANVGKFVFLGFSLFFQPRSETVLLLKSSRLTHYMAVVQNPWHYQYGCAMYVRRSTQMIYVKRQDRLEQMGDMLDSAMCQANVARRREIGACVPVDQKNAPLWREGVLRIKFSLPSIEQCEGED
jgi:hypothetical protein